MQRSHRILAASVAAALAFAGQPAWAGFTGTWNTDYGTLKLYKVKSYVVGDYADRGVILGKLRGRCLAGVFTNGDRFGNFRFRLMPGERRFNGQWGWTGKSLGQNWQGRKTGNAAPKVFQNFARGGQTTQRISNPRADYNGVYSSDYGQLKLIHRDLFLIGDYADRGILAGMWDGNSFVGVFTNRQLGRAGWFDFGFYSANATFRQGSWGWVDGGRQGNWSMQRRSASTPRLEQMIAEVSCPSGAPQTFATAKLNVPQTYQFDLDRGAVQPNGADLWFQAETANRLYLAPRNGALINVGDRSNRGRNGCSGGQFSSSRVPLSDLPVGSYICMRTDEGRVSQFRINGISPGSPKTLRIGFTTWAK